MRCNSRCNYLACTLAKTGLPAVFAACLLAAGHPLIAQAATTFNWTNGSGNDMIDNSSANWSTTGGNTIWGASIDDIATFNATPTPTTVTVAAVLVTAGGLTFNASGWNLSAASSMAPGFASDKSVSTPFTVTLAAGVSASSDVAIANSVAHGLLVTGAGTFTTTNANATYNAFTGGVTITNGATLSTGTATANAVLGPITNTVTLDNGTLAAAATIILSHTIFLGSGGGSVAETASTETLTLANPIFDGNADDALTVSTANLGAVITSAVNGYTGATNIMSGTLKLTGAGTIASSSQINVAAGASFDVSAITGYTVAAQTLTGSGGTVVGDTALGAAGIFLANLAAATPTLHFRGNLDLTALPALALSGTADGTDNYTLATFAGIESGTFSAASVAALPAGYTIDYGDLFPNAITLIAPDPPADPVPEPATLALLTLGGVALLARRRHEPRRI